MISVESIKMLVDAKADLDVINNDYLAPVDFGIDSSNSEVKGYLKSLVGRSKKLADWRTRMWYSDIFVDVIWLKNDILNVLHLILNENNTKNAKTGLYLINILDIILYHYCTKSSFNQEYHCKICFKTYYNPVPVLAEILM